MKLKFIEALKERSRHSRRFRVLAMLITAAVGLSVGLLLRGEPGVSPDSLRMRSTAELLRILEREDSIARQMHRRVAGLFPARFRTRANFLNPVHPNQLKLQALSILRGRTDESAVIGPALADCLKGMSPTNLFAGACADSLTEHGVTASNAVPWLESVLPGALTNLAAGVSFVLRSDTAVRALVAVSPDHSATYRFLTNQIERFAFPTKAEITRVVGPAYLWEDWLNRNLGMHTLITSIAQLAEPSREQRAAYLARLLENPYRPVRTAAWDALVVLDPGNEAARRTALEWLNQPPDDRSVLSVHIRSTLLRELLEWSGPHPELLADVLPHLEGVFDRNPVDYWQLAQLVAKLGRPAHPAAGSLGRHLFRFRTTAPHGWTRSDGARTYSVPDELVRFLREAGFDSTELLHSLRTTALDPSNPYRLDDARLISQLSGDQTFERELLESSFEGAPADLRKLRLQRLVELHPDTASALLVAASHLEDAEPQVRRHALIAIGTFGGEATNLLERVTGLSAADPSPIVRYQARRTANLLLGLDPETGLREESVP